MNCTNRIPILLTALAAGGLFTSLASRAHAAPMMGIEVGYEQSTDADLKGTGGESLKISRTSASFHLIQPFAQGHVLTYAVEGARYDYDFSSPQPWKEVDQVSHTIVYEHRLSEQWSVMGLGILRSAWSTNPSAPGRNDELGFGDGVGWIGGIGAKYRRSESLSYLFGVVYVTRLEDNDLVIPLVGVEWAISDRLTLEAMMDLNLKFDLFGDGSGIINLGLDYALSDFRIPGDATDQTEAAVRPEGVGLSLGYTHQLTEQVALSAKVTGYSDQEFKTYRDGHKVSSFKTDSSVFFGVGLTVNF